jgi:RNA exonuclease 1
MTKERLARATHTVASIQSALLDSSPPIITSHTILLGHSLECDLKALQIKHPLCIDTALLYKHPRGAPYKPALKWLAQKWLGREIQNQAGGHDSEEDARTCVDLLKLKIANGQLLKPVILILANKPGPDFGAFNDTTEAIFERVNRFIPTTASSSSSKSGQSSAVCDYANLKSGHGGKATTTVKCENDDEILDAMLEHVEGHHLVFGRFMELANVQGCKFTISSYRVSSL